MLLVNPSLHHVKRFTFREYIGKQLLSVVSKGGLGVQTYPVLLFESCGIAKLAGLQGRPRLLQPELALGSLLFEILKKPTTSRKSTR